MNQNFALLAPNATGLIVLFGAAVALFILAVVVSDRGGKINHAKHISLFRAARAELVDKLNKAKPRHQSAISDQIDALDERWRRRGGTFNDTSYYPGWAVVVRSVLGVLGLLVLILAVILTVSYANDTKRDRAEWETTVSEWALNTYGVRSGIPSLESNAPYLCVMGNETIVTSCEQGSVIIGAGNDRKIKKVGYILVGNNPALIDYNTGEELPRLATADERDYELVLERDPFADFFGNPDRSTILPALIERYNVKDALIPSTAEDCTLSETCFSVTFITADDELAHGLVAVEGKDVFLTLADGLGDEYDPDLGVQEQIDRSLAEWCDSLAVCTPSGNS